MNKKLINWLGLTGLLAFISYTAAVIIAPSAFPGYSWMEQAVSDLSAETAPSKLLWNQIAAFHGVGSMICLTLVSVYVSEHKTGTRLFRAGVYLFAIMELFSSVGYKMFPLADSGKEIESFQEIMHMAITAAVVLLSIVSLTLFIIAGCREKKLRSLGIIAAIALAMMFVGAIGFKAAPTQYFGIFERFSVFSAVGFCAILGLYLFDGFKKSSEA